MYDGLLYINQYNKVIAFFKKNPLPLLLAVSSLGTAFFYFKFQIK